ncbi:MAG TPA: hypothetical protein VNO26_07625, partial [Candidatus Limnocylindria bacterium]|nr:hypothetical protein [Candidatus Limnocylindria bacterium]
GAAMLAAHALAFAPGGASLAPGSSALPEALAIASAATSAALLGGSCTAMVLGHWYLVIPSLEVRHLQRIVRFHIASLVLRGLVVGLIVLLAARGALPAGVELGAYVTSLEGVFFWQRVLFGLAAPAVLAWLTWETAKIRSTQSATGILYVDFFTIVVGEGLAKYLWLATGLPL